jgi:hypothetical protein
MLDLNFIYRPIIHGLELLPNRGPRSSIGSHRPVLAQSRTYLPVQRDAVRMK